MQNRRFPELRRQGQKTVFTLLLCIACFVTALVLLFQDTPRSPQFLPINSQFQTPPNPLSQFHATDASPKRRSAIASNLQTESYANMALVLGYTIQKYNPYLFEGLVDLVLMVPHDNNITPRTISRLEQVGWKIRMEEDLTVPGIELIDPYFRRNFFKLRVWTWSEYRKLVLLDADTIVLGDISLLLSDGFDFGAIPDTWKNSMPDNKFNAGVLSLSPSLETFYEILNFTHSLQPLPWDGEQGILNQFFPAPTPNRIYPSKYTRMILPMKYNVNLEACRSHKEQFFDLWPDARIVHYTVSKPPWSVECVGNHACPFVDTIERWYQEFEEMKTEFGWDISGVATSSTG